MSCVVWSAVALVSALHCSLSSLHMVLFHGGLALQLAVLEHLRSVPPMLLRLGFEYVDDEYCNVYLKMLKYCDHC